MQLEREMVVLSRGNLEVTRIDPRILGTEEILFVCHAKEGVVAGFDMEAGLSLVVDGKRPRHERRGMIEGRMHQEQLQCSDARGPFARDHLQ